MPHTAQAHLCLHHCHCSPHDFSVWIFAQVLGLSADTAHFWFSNCLWSPLHCLIHCHCATHFPLRPLSGCPEPILLSVWKPPCLHNTCILHTCKSTTLWMIQRFTTLWNSSQLSLEHSCRYLWVTGWLSLMIMFLVTNPIVSLGQEFSSQRTVVHLFPVDPMKVESHWFLRCHQDIFSTVLK